MSAVQTTVEPLPESDNDLSRDPMVRAAIVIRRSMQALFPDARLDDLMRSERAAMIRIHAGNTQDIDTHLMGAMSGLSALVSITQLKCADAINQGRTRDAQIYGNMAAYMQSIMTTTSRALTIKQYLGQPRGRARDRREVIER